jgi:ABC-type branched-subunit amino acid transport system substrate-binding protein
MTITRRFSALLLLIALSAFPALAQMRLEYSDMAEQQFRAAVALYDAGAYREAAIGFDRVIREFPGGHRISAAYIMKGKALYHAGENLESSKTMKAFLSRFPASSYTADAELFLGSVYDRIGRHDDALEMLLHSLRHLPAPAPEALTRAIGAALDSTAASCSLVTMRGFLRDQRSMEERTFLWITIAEKEAATQNLIGAGFALDSLAALAPSPGERLRSADLRSRLAARNNVKLGALLPLMRKGDPSAGKDIANEVLDGILYAVETHAKAKESRVSVGLETRDTEREPRLATKGAEDLAGDRDVIGILGPVFSPTVTSAAAVANARGVPLVTPTANANGIAAIGPYVFQANPDYDARGRAMARYAVTVRGFRTLAVLAPIDAYGKFLAEGFMREAQRLGAAVLANEWYQKGTSDLKQQLAKIRREGMVAGADAKLAFGGRMRPGTLMKFVDLGVPLRRVDSLMAKGATVSARWLLGPHARMLLDSLAIPLTFDESQVDSLEYPVDAIDALYAPIAGPEEIGVVSSQVVYFNFKTQILGSGEWNNFAELNSSRRYTDGVVFESDSYIDTTGGGYASFVSGFGARFKKKPTKNALFGYDVASMVLSLIEAGATTREALQKALSALVDYRGIHSRVSLTTARVNTRMTVLQYVKDEIRKVDDINADLPPEGGRGAAPQGR